MKSSVMVIVLAMLVVSSFSIGSVSRGANGCCPGANVTYFANQTSLVNLSGSLLAPASSTGGNDTETATENAGENVGMERVEGQLNRANVTLLPSRVQVQQSIEPEAVETTQEIPGMERVESQTNRTGTQTVTSSGSIPEREVHYINGTGMTSAELLAIIAQQERDANDTIANLPAEMREVRMSNSQASIAIGSLIAAGSNSGTTGTTIVQLAQEINSSLETSHQLEQQINAGNGFLKFFTGGDTVAATGLQDQITQNQARMASLQTLINGGMLSPDVSSILNQQILALNNENNRLQVIARNELDNKGLFRGIFKQ